MRAAAWPFKRAQAMDAASNLVHVEIQGVPLGIAVGQAETGRPGTSVTKILDTAEPMVKQNVRLGMRLVTVQGTPVGQMSAVKDVVTVIRAVATRPLELVFELPSAAGAGSRGAGHGAGTLAMQVHDEGVGGQEGQEDDEGFELAPTDSLASLASQGSNATTDDDDSQQNYLSAEEDDGDADDFFADKSTAQWVRSGGEAAIKRDIAGIERHGYRAR